MDNIMAIIWLALLIVFLLGEAATSGLVAIWFAGGAAVALIVSLFLPFEYFWVQLLVFILVSGLLLACTRPLARKFVQGRKTATNADRNIGEIGVVHEAIDNLENLGQVMVGGKMWTARSADGSAIEQNARVRVMRIEGVKAIVERENPSGSAQ